MLAQHLVEFREGELAVADDRPSGDDGVARRERSAAEPGLDRVRPGAREQDSLERPGDEVAAGARCEQAELTCASEAGGRADGGDLEHVAGAHRGCSVSQPAEQERRSRLEPERGVVGRGRSVAAEPDGDARRAQFLDGRDPDADQAVRARAVRDTGSPAAKTRDFAVVDEDAVRDPGAVARPAERLEAIDGALAEVFERERFLGNLLSRSLWFSRWN